MFFLRADAKVLKGEPNLIENGKRRRHTNSYLQKEMEEVLHTNYNYGKLFIFVSSVIDSKLIAGVIMRPESRITKGEMRRQIVNAARSQGIEIEEPAIVEITMSVLFRMLEVAKCNGYIMNYEELLKWFEIDTLEYAFSHGDHLSIREEILAERQSRASLERKTKKSTCKDALLPELNRIYSGKKQTLIKGHPVQYLLQTDDEQIREQVVSVLLAALYSRRRIRKRRYTVLDMNAKQGRRASFETSQLYEASDGGAIVVICPSEDKEERNIAAKDTETLISLCNLIKKYRNRVLTITCIGKADEDMKSRFYKNLEDCSVIEIKEDSLKGGCAKEYLCTIAAEHHVDAGNSLLSCIKDEKSYAVSELQKVYDSWFDNYLKQEIYPQYSQEICTYSVSYKTESGGSAYEQLQSLVGLQEVKTMIGHALDYYRLDGLYRKKGIIRERPAMHMMFTGSPGTAKTTVARLFAQIMKENGILANGKLFEVGRADLVGKYVGWTAQMVKEKFRDARGSVLFIDEAYSLLGSDRDLFGNEAINTIVQEMENHRGELIVIFAGYPMEMEEFISSNPGLRSRIAFQVPFRDYSAQELYEIAGQMAHERSLVLDAKAKDRLIEIFERAKKSPDFGNGRFVRKLLEQAAMKQASRLLQHDPAKLSSEELCLITDEDFDFSMKLPEKRRHSIGFATCSANSRR